jgi:hypothetical protein
MAKPLSKGSKPGQGLTVSHAVRSFFARDNVVDATNRESVNLSVAFPGVVKTLDSVRRKDDVKVKGTVLELNEVLARL